MSEKSKIKPLGARVLIRPIEGENVTSSGIYIPETAKEKPQNGEIVAIGDDDDIKVKVGQTVIYPKYTGTEVKIDGVEHIIIDFSDLLAVVKE